MLNMNTFTMDVILKIKTQLKPIYTRQSSGTVLINIPEQKKKQNNTNIVAISKNEFWTQSFLQKKL